MLENLGSLWYSNDFSKGTSPGKEGTAVAVPEFSITSSVLDHTNEIRRFLKPTFPILKNSAYTVGSFNDDLVEATLNEIRGRTYRTQVCMMLRVAAN